MKVQSVYKILMLTALTQLSALTAAFAGTPPAGLDTKVWRFPFIMTNHCVTVIDESYDGHDLLGINMTVSLLLSNCPEKDIDCHLRRINIPLVTYHLGGLGWAPSEEAIANKCAELQSELQQDISNHTIPEVKNALTVYQSIVHEQKDPTIYMDEFDQCYQTGGVGFDVNPNPNLYYSETYRYIYADDTFDFGNKNWALKSDNYDVKCPVNGKALYRPR